MSLETARSENRNRAYIYVRTIQVSESPCFCWPFPWSHGCRPIVDLRSNDYETYKTNSINPLGNMPNKKGGGRLSMTCTTTSAYFFVHGILIYHIIHCRWIGNGVLVSAGVLLHIHPYR